MHKKDGTETTYGLTSRASGLRSLIKQPEDDLLFDARFLTHSQAAELLLTARGLTDHLLQPMGLYLHLLTSRHPTSSDRSRHRGSWLRAWLSQAKYEDALQIWIYQLTNLCM
jgi:hypothetical protein